METISEELNHHDNENSHEPDFLQLRYVTTDDTEVH
jgi:hypothetical protein